MNRKVLRKITLTGLILSSVYAMSAMAFSELPVSDGNAPVTKELFCSKEKGYNFTSAAWNSVHPEYIICHYQSQTNKTKTITRKLVNTSDYEVMLTGGNWHYIGEWYGHIKSECKAKMGYSKDCPVLYVSKSSRHDIA